MNETEEMILYDAMTAIQRAAKLIVPALNEYGTEEQKEAYKSGVYAVAMKLGIVLGTDAIKRGKDRHLRIEEQVKAFFDEEAGR